MTSKQPQSTAPVESAESMNRIRRIVVPFDEGRSSERAIVNAIELARQHRAELVLIYVYQPSETGSTGGIVSPVQRQRDHQARLYIKSWCAKIASQGCAVYGYCVPGKNIRFAGSSVAREQADVIVVADDRKMSPGALFRADLVRYFEKVTSTPIVTA